MSDVNGKVKVGAWEWTVWPTLPTPTVEWLVAFGSKQGPAALDQYHRQREQLILDEKHDPAQYGWEAPPIVCARALLGGTYRLGTLGTPARGQRGDVLPAADDLLLMTGNRFGKTNFCSRYVMEILSTRKAGLARCWSQSQMTSRAEQQKMLFKHLRPDLRKVKKKGQFCKISYSQATGFSEETFILDNDPAEPSQCYLFTYHSWQQDKNIGEGGEADVIWFDEEVPGELLETTRFRTGQKRMVLLVSFTPVTGYTDAVAQYIEGARVLETVPARRVVFDWWNRTWTWGEWLLSEHRELVPGCPRGHVPFLLDRPGIPGRYTLCAATAWNPYITLEDVLKKAQNSPLETQLIRWFGWPTNRVRKAFPHFGETHIVAHDRLPPREELTIYLAVDPHGQRNWFMVWIGVDRENRKWVIDEWPDAELGEWAVPGQRPDGKPGPAQQAGSGRGFDHYKLLILQREGWRETQGKWEPGPEALKVGEGNRMMDPRAASWTVPSQNEEQTRNYIENMWEPVKRRGSEGENITIAPGLDFVRAPGCSVMEGNELINDWITGGWDPRRPVDALNCPRFYVSEKCQNVIWALRTFTGQGPTGRVDEEGACKDPIDCLKAAAKSDIRWMGAGTFGTLGGKGGTYGGVRYV